MTNIVVNSNQDNPTRMRLSQAWYSIWFKPRGTIRAIVDQNPDYGVIILAIISGVARFLDRASERSLGDSMELGWLLVMAVVTGGIAGILGLYIGGAFLRWVGSWLGGVATTKEVRTALAWSSIPDVLLFLGFGGIIALTGAEWFKSSPTFTALSLVLLALMIPVGLFILVMRIFLVIKCLAEVHRFSAWKGLFTIVIGSLIVIVPVLLFVLTWYRPPL